MEKHLHCVGTRASGKPCRRPLTGRQRLYCGRLCRVYAKSKRRQNYQHNYYLDNKDAISDRKRNKRQEKRLEAERVAEEKARQQKQSEAPVLTQDDLEAMGILPQRW